MKSIDFHGAEIKIGKGQPQYNVIHAMPMTKDESCEILACFELSDEELAEVNRTKKIYYTRLTFPITPVNETELAKINETKLVRHYFQPMRIFAILGDVFKGLELNFKVEPQNTTSNDTTSKATS